LDNTDSLIANYIYQDFLTQTDIRLSATGAKILKNATNQTPAYLIAQHLKTLSNSIKGIFTRAFMVILLTITDAMI
jgi:hypothetical protein